MIRVIFQAIADTTAGAIIALPPLPAMAPTAISENDHTIRHAVSQHLRINQWIVKQNL